MRSTVPDTLNHGRIREGAMATDDSAMFEGGFVIPSPFAKLTFFQIRSSEIGAVGNDGPTWEHVCVVVKRVKYILGREDIAEQRAPTDPEIRYIMSLFWDADESVAVFYSNSAEVAKRSKPQILHLFRPSDGWYQCPELFREEHRGEIPADGPAKVPDIPAETVADLCAARQSRSRDSSAGRRLYDIRRIVETCVEPNRATDGMMSLRVREDQWKALLALLE